MIGQRRRERIATLEAQLSRDSSLQDDQDFRFDEPQLDARGLDLGTNSHGRDAQTPEELGQGSPAAYIPSVDFDLDPFDLSLMEFTHLPSPIPSTTPSPPSFQLPLPRDGAVLSVPILDAIRAFGTVAMALNVAAHLWDPCYLHILSPCIPALSSLPANMHPVPAQLTIPHHPLLDLLPWPSVREKLICMLSMPSAFRPPVAKEIDDDDEPCQAFPTTAARQGDDFVSGGVKQSTAIVQLVQDLDDLQDGAGVRVHGNRTAWGEGNELTEDAWEIGDLFYRKWWWCLDQRIVELSNSRRRERGLPRLKMIS
jgi:hypothetical protein